MVTKKEVREHFKVLEKYRNMDEYDRGYLNALRWILDKKPDRNPKCIE